MDVRTSQFTLEQVIGYLKQADAGIAVAEICRKGGFSNATFHKWRAEFEQPSEQLRGCARR